MPARDQNLILAFGSNKQTGVGVVSTTFNQFLKLDRDIPFLRYGTETDEDWVGKATEFAFNVYPTAYDFSSKIEKNASAEFTCWAWAYAMGVAGYSTSLYTLTPLVPATTIEMIYFSMAAKLAEGGGEAFDELYYDCAMEDVLTTFEYGPGLKSAKTTCSFHSTGNNLIPSGITYPSSPVVEHYMLSSSMAITINGIDYVNGTGGVGVKCALKGSMGWKNNLILPLRYFPGSGLLNNAAIGGRIFYGKRVPTLDFTVFLEATSTEYAKLVAQTNGSAVITLTYDATHYVTWTYPSVQFSMVERKAEEGVAAVDVKCAVLATSSTNPLIVTSKNALTTIAQ